MTSVMGLAFSGAMFIFSGIMFYLASITPPPPKLMMEDTNTIDGLSLNQRRGFSHRAGSAPRMNPRAVKSFSSDDILSLS